MGVFDIKDLTKQTFGYVATPFYPQKLNSYKAKGLSLLGTPFYFPTKIENISLPNEPIIIISGSKTIIRTQIDGIEGSFKEGFSLNDWQVTIAGFCIQEDIGSEEYPDVQVRQIRELIERKSSLKIVNEFLSIFNIDRIAIESFSFPEAPGAPSVQPYQLNCWSDKTIELEFKTTGSLPADNTAQLA